MEEVVTECLEGVSFGEIQLHRHVAVCPVVGAGSAGPDYLTMKEALADNLLTVSEISESGHVPELKVANRAEKPVLLLDGEELAGAKQNRVLNTTILLKEKQETIIPVSCTEQGRWSYRTGCFKESGHIMSARLRSVKNASVHENLKYDRTYRSNQGAVWDGIAFMARENKINAPTGAMRDILEAKQEELDRYLVHFPVIAGQNGLLVMVNGKVVGLDIVSRVAAYKKFHSKLIRSYVMDALTETPSEAPPESSAPLRESAAKYLAAILQCGENGFNSAGYGRDYRYEGNRIVGSALVHENAVIHTAFFQVAAPERAGRMSSVSRRRAYRTQQ